MMQFEFSYPTRYVFGAGSIDRIGGELQSFGRVLFLHGGASDRLGVTDVVRASVSSGRSLVEIGGLGSNPDEATVASVLDRASEFEPDLILAVGGGSVIDLAKALSVAVVGGLRGTCFCEWASTSLRDARGAVPVGVVLTLPASGSESNTSFVVADRVTGRKHAFASKLVVPKFAICDPDVIPSIPRFQLMCGLSDIMSHLLEQLFCVDARVDLTDRLIVASIASLLECREAIDLAPVPDWAYGEIMRIGTIALSYLFSLGRKCDWVAHEIDHRCSSELGVPHGQAMASIMPAWIQSVRTNSCYAAKLDFLAEELGGPSRLSGAEIIASFFKGLGIESVALSRVFGSRRDELIETVMRAGPLGRCLDLTPALLAQVFELASRSRGADG